MSTAYGFKVEGSGQGWSGPSPMLEMKRRGRGYKLRVLLEALKAGNVEAAQAALDDLWAFDALLKSDPYLIKIGEALSKKMLYFAQKTALAMQSDPTHFSAQLKMTAGDGTAQAPSPSQSQIHSQAHKSAGAGQPKTSALALPVPAHATYPVLSGDIQPKKATTGEFGRIIDICA